MRHASRSQGGVVEQELSSFLKANRMAGVILARPVEQAHMSHNDVWNYSSQTVAEMVANAPSDVMVIGDSRLQLEPANGMYERMTQIVRDTGAGMAYSDSVGHPRIDYQLGSIRDNFDCGAVLAISVPAAREALAQANGSPQYQWGGLYDLRLRLSETRPIIRIPETLYDSFVEEDRPDAEAQFDYVDPRNRDYQIEMEQIATRHLERIGAALPPPFSQGGAFHATRLPWRQPSSFPFEIANVTIFEAVWSALSQKTGVRIQRHRCGQSFDGSNHRNSSRHRRPAADSHRSGAHGSWHWRLLESCRSVSGLRTLRGAAGFR